MKRVPGFLLSCLVVLSLPLAAGASHPDPPKPNDWYVTYPWQSTEDNISSGGATVDLWVYTDSNTWPAESHNYSKRRDDVVFGEWLTYSSITPNDGLTAHYVGYHKGGVDGRTPFAGFKPGGAGNKAPACPMTNPGGGGVLGFMHRIPAHPTTGTPEYPGQPMFAYTCFAGAGPTSRLYQTIITVNPIQAFYADTGNPGSLWDFTSMLMQEVGHSMGWMLGDDAPGGHFDPNSTICNPTLNASAFEFMCANVSVITSNAARVAARRFQLHGYTATYEGYYGSCNREFGVPAPGCLSVGT